MWWASNDGTVGEIEVRQGAGGDCGFEEAAIEAVSKWRYKPGTKDGSLSMFTSRWLSILPTADTGWHMASAHVSSGS